MQLITRLLLRLGLLGLLMLILSFVFTLIAARQDMVDEIQGSQRIGQLLTVLSALQDDAPLTEHAQRIDQLNDSDTLRHFHVALMDNQGRRMTRSPVPLPASELPWLNRFVASEVSVPGYSLSLQRPGGEKITVMLEPNPQPESSEAISSVMLQLSLFAAMVLTLVAAMAYSVRHALLPLNDILQGISRIEAGDYTTRIARSATRELNQIGQAVSYTHLTLPTILLV